MIGEGFVPRAALGFIVVAPLVLALVIARSPDTHGHTWRTFHPDYARAPLDTVGEADLDAILRDLPPFVFPAYKGVQPSMGGAAPMAGMAMAKAAASNQEVQKIALTQSEYAIAPDRATARVGVPVELTVVNEGKQVHGLWMADFGIAEDIRAGKKQVFTFTPEKPGRFRFTCSYSLCGTDEQHGRMVGFLTVQ